MFFAITAAPVAGLAKTGISLQGGDAASVFGFEFRETGAVMFFFCGALCFLFFDLVVGEDADGEEEGCHCGGFYGILFKICRRDTAIEWGIEVEQVIIEIIQWFSFTIHVVFGLFCTTRIRFGDHR